ncbi:MAG: NAD(P)-binding protein [Halobacteria archaeon]|nr:NAD(P)-binding protein [Halobacteria archaeon]
MKIAVIGTGIAGNVAARQLCREHDITVFESGNHVGGHTHTHDIVHDGRQYAIDTGFIVFNDWTYPSFIALLDELGVQSQPTAMSFSSRCDHTGIEYNGSSLNGLFAQRGNLLKPRFHGMIRDILRFNRESRQLLDSGNETLTLAEYLRENNYGRLFIDNYIIPMGAAIWSTDPGLMLDFPARYFVRFFVNHGLLNIRDRPQWRVIKGGSREYVKVLSAPYSDRIRLNEGVDSIRRLPNHVELHTTAGNTEKFDYVFVATHSDQALRLLSDPDRAERDVLGAIPYQNNDVVLHTDISLLPEHRRTWAAWNYRRRRDSQRRVSVTYNMNMLQGIDAAETFCVTLNDTDNIDPGCIISRLQYEHPVYTPDGVAAQKRHGEINGRHRTWYCGAYWRYGFHEDGVVSALTAIEDFREHLKHAQPSLLRAG